MVVILQDFYPLVNSKLVKTCNIMQFNFSYHKLTDLNLYEHKLLQVFIVLNLDWIDWN